MRGLILAAGLLIAGLTGGTANAMPAGGVSAPSSSLIQTVDWACGRGFHLSPRGYCRPNRWAPPPPPRHVYRHHRRDHWDHRGPPRHWRERDRFDGRDWRDHREWRRDRDWR
ncbi:hypothetical protein M0654_03850 [Rhizobium sp. NTR19]|uniref:Uncharacterized protein n=1 Tax=Neorhizobium turbinariae TaxID=2937795 RepID=A0ABT0IMN1_9HYPH|nr:hypothetical protein [Neorhizobium turbinariae]MCK8779113.1 hypothetical protein [Neorhizobium turbinariae]